MDDKWARYAEAYKRGILPPDKKIRYEEAMRRGLVPNAQSVTSVASSPVQENAAATQNDTLGRLYEAGVLNDDMGRQAQEYASEQMGGAPRFPEHERKVRDFVGTPQGWARVPGRTLRAGISGLTALPDLPIGFVNALNASFGGDPHYFKTFSGLANAGLDLAGVSRPANEFEARADNVASAIAGAAIPIMAGRQLAARAPQVGHTVASGIGKVLGASPRTQIAATTSGTGLQQAADAAGLGTGVQAGAGLIGGMLAPSTVAAKRGISSGLGNLVNQEKLAAFRKAGIEVPSLGAVSDSGVVQGLESALSQGVFSRGRMQQAQIKGAKGLTQAVDDAAERLAGGQYYPRQMDEAGALARQAAQTSKERFQQTAADFENKVYRPAGTTKARLNNTFAEIRQRADQYSPHTAADYENKAINNLGNTYLDDRIRQLNINTLRRDAGRIGEQLKAPPTAGTMDVTQHELKGLYGALKRDIEDALPEPLRGRVSKYNAWYSARKALADEVDKTFFKGDNAATAKAILSAEGEQLDKLRRIVGPDGYSMLRAAALKQASLGNGVYGDMGLASSAYLGRNLGLGRGAMPESTQRALFGDEVNNLRVLARALNQSKIASNTSNTAGAISGLDMIDGAVGNPATWLQRIGGTAAGLAGGARLATSPRIIDRLARWGQTPVAPTRGAIAPLGAGLLELLAEQE